MSPNGSAGESIPAPRDVVAELEALAVQRESTFGPSRIVWRRWGEGMPVVLLHGGAGSWTHWIRNIPSLARDRAVWVPDLPGYGESDPLPEPLTFGVIAEAIEEGIRALLPPRHPIDVVGFSFGAHLGVHLAKRLPDRMHRLVLIGGNFVDGSGPDRPGFVNWKKAAGPGERAAALRRNLNVMMIADPEKIDELALHLYVTDVIRQRIRPMAIVGRRSMPKELLDVPTHIRVTGISGAREQVFGHILHRQADALRSVRPDAAFYLVPGGGHWVMYEAADSFNELLGRVLTSDAEIPTTAILGDPESAATFPRVEPAGEV